MRKRSELLAPVPHPHSPYNLPEIGKPIAYNANRGGGAERIADPAVPKHIAVDLALITSDDPRLGDLELSIVKAATHQDAKPLDLLPTVPGIGTILSLVLLDEIHQIERCPSVQDFASYGRLVTCRQESGGKRLGPAGAKIGTAHLKGAFSEAALLCLRNHPQGQKRLTRWQKKHETGKALSLLAPKRARAVDSRLTRPTAFDMDLFRCPSGSRAGAPGVSLDTQGMSLQRASLTSSGTASLNAKVHLGPFIPEPCALIGHLLWLLHRRRSVAQGVRVLPSPEPATNWRVKNTQPPL
jgi:hypothetical protein